LKCKNKKIKKLSPSRKKEITKSMNLLNETLRKIQEYNKNSKEFSERFQKQCGSLHIKVKETLKFKNERVRKLKRKLEN
jgi:hypothetical protein